MPNKLTNAEIQKIIPLIEQTKWHYRLDKFTDDSLKLVNKSVNQARREVAAKLATINPKSEFTKQRLETLAQELQDMTVAIQHKITGQIENVVTEVAAKSYKKHADILSFGGLVPNFNAVQLTAVQLKSIVDTPVGGKLLDEWVDTSFTANIKDKFQEGIATGMLKGESYKSLVKRFKTEAFTGLEKDMEAITRTQVQTINTNAMNDTMKANADIIKGWKWNSVYENRTCIRCMSLDAKGEVYPIDGGPPIPLHINCRCFPEPITKTFRELGVDIDEVKDSYRPYTIRGKIDPVTGRVIPGKIGVGGGRIIDTGRFLGSYDDFFKQLPENVQMQMLGPTRHGLYKSGKLPLSGLTDAKGNAFLIKELEKGIKKSFFTMTVDETLIKTAAKALSEKEILSNADLINKAMLKKAKELDIEEEFMVLTAPRSYTPSNSYWSSRPIAAGETKAQLELEGWAVDGKEVYYQKNPPKWMPKDLAGKQLSSTFASSVNLQSYFGEPPNIPAMTNFKKMLEGKYGKKFQLSAELVQKNNQAIFREMYGESTKFYRAGGVKSGVQSMSESTSAAKHAASVVGKTSKVTSESVEIFEHQILVSHRGFVTPYPEKEWVVDLSAKVVAKKEAQVVKELLDKEAAEKLKKLEEKLQKELAEAVAKKEAAEKLAKDKLAERAAKVDIPKGWKVSSTVNKEFDNQCKISYNELPQKAKDLIETSGYNIRIGKTLTSIYPELKGVTPRGWPEGSTWDNVSGLNWGSKDSIVVAEKYIPIGGTKFAKSLDASHTIKHETGHIVDQLMDRVSSSTKFKKAYKKDVENISDYGKSNLAYFLQEGSAGREETFAQLFASIAGDTMWSVAEAFPNSFKLVKELFKN